MKVAIVGSRGLQVAHLENYLPAGVTEIVSGGSQRYRHLRKSICTLSSDQTDRISAGV